ncbi:MAG TPA: TIGR01777 family oxidoreductase [Anaerolineaceae bacterium]|nr:TIGR01777 family oxidoreductase [Anaerolineaceae bacterium]
MNILISGGTGLIGQALTKNFIKSGHKIIILTRGNRDDQNPDKIQYVKWDGRSFEPLIPIMEEVDVVINLAGDNIGAGSWTKQKKERILNSRLFAGNALSEAIVKAKVKPEVFIQASGVGYYGTSKDMIFDETSKNGDDYLANISMQWEDSSKSVEDVGVRRVIIRTGVVLDKSTGVLPLMTMPFRFFVGGALGDGNQMISWIHLQDEVKAIEFIVNNKSISGPVNLVSPFAVKNSEFGKTIAKVIKRPYWFPTPAFLLKLLLGEKSTLVLDGQVAYPKKLLDEGYTFLFSNLTDALLDLYQ